MTKTQVKLIESMKAAIADGSWTNIGNNTIRYRETAETPEINRGNGFGRWPEPTYTRCLFISIVAGKSWSIFFREARAPWVEALDYPITFKRAFEVLADPAGQF